MPKVVDHAHRRDHVAELAQEVICDAGLSALTMRDVAARGGWSPTAVTHYFRTRDDLLLYTLEHSRRQARDRVDHAIGAGVAPLRAIVEQTLPLDAARASQWKVWLAFWGSAVGTPALAEAQHLAQVDFRHSLEVALAATGVPESAAESARLVALVDGISIQAIFSPADWPPSRQLSYFELD